jgi:predicted methyltransferase
MGDLAPFLVRFGEILDEVQSNNDALALSLETAFSAPMEVKMLFIAFFHFLLRFTRFVVCGKDFVSREVKAVGKLRCEMAQALAEHESAIFKYLQLKRTAEEVCVVITCDR